MSSPNYTETIRALISAAVELEKRITDAEIAAGLAVRSGGDHAISLVGRCFTRPSQTMRNAVIAYANVFVDAGLVERATVTGMLRDAQASFNADTKKLRAAIEKIFGELAAELSEHGLTIEISKLMKSTAAAMGHNIDIVDLGQFKTTGAVN